MQKISGREQKRRKEQSWKAKGGNYLHTPDGPVRATPCGKGAFAVGEKRSKP